jgi:hypothetical protein
MISQGKRSALLIRRNELVHLADNDKERFCMATKDQKEVTYHAGIGGLLRAAYKPEFNMMEMGRCKRKFETFSEWYKTLKPAQKERVEAYLSNIYDRKT